MASCCNIAESLRKFGGFSFESRKDQMKRQEIKLHRWFDQQVSCPFDVNCVKFRRDPAATPVLSRPRTPLWRFRGRHENEPGNQHLSFLLLQQFLLECGK